MAAEEAVARGGFPAAYQVRRLGEDADVEAFRLEDLVAHAVLRRASNGMLLSAATASASSRSDSATARAAAGRASCGVSTRCLRSSKRALCRPASRARCATAYVVVGGPPCGSERVVAESSRGGDEGGGDAGCCGCAGADSAERSSSSVVSRLLARFTSTPSVRKLEAAPPDACCALLKASARGMSPSAPGRKACAPARGWLAWLALSSPGARGSRRRRRAHPRPSPTPRRPPRRRRGRAARQRCQASRPSAVRRCQGQVAVAAPPLRPGESAAAGLLASAGVVARPRASVLADAPAATRLDRATRGACRACSAGGAESGERVKRDAAWRLGDGAPRRLGGRRAVAEPAGVDGRGRGDRAARGAGAPAALGISASMTRVGPAIWTRTSRYPGEGAVAARRSRSRRARRHPGRSRAERAGARRHVAGRARLDERRLVARRHGERGGRG